VPVRDGDTTSFAVVDAAGNAVSFIQSVFSTWGAAVLVPGTGVLLNNRLTAFSLDLDSPNALAPDKRTVHTLNTWLLERGDGTFFAGGTPGANFQVQVNLQVIRGLVDWRLDPQLAIDAPRWGFIQGELLMESRFPAETIDGLRRRGYTVRPIAAWEVQLSRSQLVGRLPGQGTLFAASDLRSEGLALAW
jgi:gamma-glutamyltranspeptidase/glutathione hydrolase